MARTEGDRTGLLSLFSNGPRIHVSDKSVMLLVCTRAESNIFSGWRSFGVNKSRRRSVFDLGVS